MVVGRMLLLAVAIPVAGLLSGCFISNQSQVADAEVVYPLPDGGQLIQYDAKAPDQCAKLELFGPLNPIELDSGNVLCPTKVFEIRKIEVGYEFPPLVPDGDAPMRAKFVAGRADQHFIELALPSDDSRAYLYALGNVTSQNGVAVSFSMWLPACNDNAPAYQYAGPADPSDNSSCFVSSPAAFAGVMPILQRDNALVNSSLSYVFGVRVHGNKVARFSHGNREFVFDELIATDSLSDEHDFIMDEMCGIEDLNNADMAELACLDQVEALYRPLSTTYDGLDEAGKAKMMTCLRGRPLDLNFGDLAVRECLEANSMAR